MGDIETSSNPTNSEIINPEIVKLSTILFDLKKQLGEIEKSTNEQKIYIKNFTIFMEDVKKNCK